MRHHIDQHQHEIIKNWLGTGSINIFGPQFAGKDTQGQYLVEAFGAAPLIGGGDILRNTTLPQHVKDIMDQGELVPIKDYVEIVLPYLNRTEFRGKPLILSAVGRWHGEEEGVLEVTSDSNHPLKAVIYITLSEEISWQRWKAQEQPRNGGLRQDETEQALEARLKEFREKTIPVIEFYRNMGVLIEIDGQLERKEAFKDIIKKLFERAKAQV